MKITIEAHNETSVIDTEHDDLDIHEMMDLVERALIASGYHPNSVQEGFNEKAEEIKEETGELESREGH